jgi:hypothetical protein
VARPEGPAPRPDAVDIKKPASTAGIVDDIAQKQAPSSTALFAVERVVRSGRRGPLLTRGDTERILGELAQAHRAPAPEPSAATPPETPTLAGRSRAPGTR